MQQMVQVKKRKPNRAKLVKKLDGVCSEFVKKRANGICEVCGKVGTQTAHPYSKKAFPHLRFYLPQLIWSCFYCHIRRSHQLGEFELFRDILLRRLGKFGYEALKENAYRYKGRTFETAEIEEMLDSKDFGILQALPEQIRAKKGN